MERVKWELIGIARLKEWAELIKLDSKLLEAEWKQFHKNEKSEEEYFGEKILFYLNKGCYCPNESKGIPEGQKPIEERINFNELKEKNKDLYDFWQVAKLYWDYKVNSNTPKSTLERTIKALNEYIESKYK